MKAQALDVGAAPLMYIIPFPKHINYARTGWTSVAKIPSKGRGTRAGWLWTGWDSMT